MPSGVFLTHIVGEIVAPGPSCLAQVALIALIPALLGLTAPSGGICGGAASAGWQRQKIFRGNTSLRSWDVLVKLWSKTAQPLLEVLAKLCHLLIQRLKKYEFGSAGERRSSR